MSERVRPHDTLSVTPDSSLPSEEQVQLTAARIIWFANERTHYYSNSALPIDHMPNAIDITIHPEEPDIWDEIRRAIPAEQQVFYERDLDIEGAELDGVVQEEVNYAITIGQTEHAGFRGVKESLDEISVWSDDKPYYFKIYPDGRITERSRRTIDHDPNPPVDPWKPLHGLPITRKPHESVPLYEVPLTGERLGELNGIMDKFEEMALQERLVVNKTRHRVDRYFP